MNLDKGKKIQTYIVNSQIGTLRAFEEWSHEDETIKSYEIEYLLLSQHRPSEAKCVLHKRSTEVFLPPSCLAKPQLLLVGTSLNAKIEAEAYIWAKNNKITSIAFVDQWINYKERFIEAAPPDYVFVLDDAAQADLLNECSFFNSNQILQAGSPALNGLLGLSRPNIRNRSESQIFYYATEPSSYAGKDEEYKARHGIFDLEGLKFICDYLISTNRQNYILKILLHPNDNRERVENFLMNNNIKMGEQLVFANETKPEVFEKADCMFGMRSFILYETGLLGIPTYSFQIGRKTKSSLTDQREFIKVLTSEADLKCLLNHNFTYLNTPPIRHKWHELIPKVLAQI